MPIVNRNDVKRLSAQHAYKPYFPYEKLIGREKLNNFFLDLVNNAPNLCSLYGEEPSAALAALGSWRNSAWDTRNIGYKTACINFLLTSGDSFEEKVRHCEALYPLLERELNRQGFEYIFYRVNASDLSVICVLQKTGYHMVDGLLTLSWQANQIPGEQETEAGTGVRGIREADLPAARQIAFSSFIYDRFHSDPAIPDQTANQLHANWIEDSFKKNPNDHVLVAEKNGTILGFISYSINEKSNHSLGKNFLDIILLATHADHRGKGIAVLLTQEVLKLARRDNFDVVQVKTQLRNITATRLYQKLNFQLVDTSYSFRKLMSCGKHDESDR